MRRCSCARFCPLAEALVCETLSFAEARAVSESCTPRTVCSTPSKAFCRAFLSDACPAEARNACAAAAEAFSASVDTRSINSVASPSAAAAAACLSASIRTFFWASARFARSCLASVILLFATVCPACAFAPRARSFMRSDSTSPRGPLPRADLSSACFCVRNPIVDLMAEAVASKASSICFALSCCGEKRSKKVCPCSPDKVTKPSKLSFSARALRRTLKQEAEEVGEGGSSKASTSSLGSRVRRCRLPSAWRPSVIANERTQM
mmetsp:Transcript_20257/g.50629  ORF Transcript_20257/g.50629 Transcript_20257/m.50629 type:complete len:265 (-) Transcript_20257:2923-3717(-)